MTPEPDPPRRRSYPLGRSSRPAPGQSWYDHPRTAELISRLMNRIKITHPGSALSSQSLTELNHAQGRAEEARFVLRLLETLRDEDLP